MTLGARLVHSRFRGCLLGVAVGDALGAPVEFVDRPTILSAYGPNGVEGFDGWLNDDRLKMRAGAVTDDTQMTVATAAGLLDSLGEWRSSGFDNPMAPIWERYLAWLETQSDPQQRRFPGRTCIAALQDGVPGSIDDPLNDSKGSGGVMRVAPVGLAYQPERAFENGVESAALTHGHPSGYLAAGFAADVVSRLVRGSRDKGLEWDAARGGRIPAAIASTREVLLGWDDHDQVLEKVDLAVELYIADAFLDEAIPLLGQGWVAEEALGIALFCALSYPTDFESGVLAAVNITGDSDTTGSLTGALLGAALGESAIRSDWASSVESGPVIVCLADQLHSGYMDDGPADAAACLA